MRVVERVDTPRGELVLRGDGEHCEVISDGTFLMDTRDGRSERLLVTAALEGATAGARVLVSGLGVGFTLVAALADPRVTAVTVVEVLPDIVRWHGPGQPLARWSAGALADPRTCVVVADLLGWLRTTTQRFDAICLDTDNGPDWLVHSDNAGLWDDVGTALLVSHLSQGGVLAVWGARAVPAYTHLLRRHVRDVEVREVEVARGEPDAVWVARTA